MFKGKVRVYKNMNGKEEEIRKDFDDEKEFNDFVKNNPDLQRLEDWKPMSWSDQLGNIKGFFERAEKIGDSKFFKEMEKEMDKLIDKGRKLLK